MANSTTLVDNALYYRPEWYLIGDADFTLMAVLYGIIAIATIWRVEDLVELWLFPKKEWVSLSDVSALITFRSSSWCEVIRWIFTRPNRTRISQKAAFGIAVRLVIYFAEFLILFGSIPRTLAVRENQVPGTSEVSFENDRVGVFNETDPIATVPAFTFKWCATDKVELLGFTPTAVRLVCMWSFRNRGKIRNGERWLSLLSEIMPSAPRYSANFSEFYAVYYHKELAALSVDALRSGTSFMYSHVLTHRTGLASNTVDRAVLLMPPNIHDQAADLALRNDTYFQCEEIHFNFSKPYRLIFCMLDPNKTVIETSFLPIHLLNRIGTRKVGTSTEKMVGFDVNNSNIFKHTNFILGEVNRPRLCLIPASMLLAILVMLSVISRMWFSSGNVTLELWKCFSSKLDSRNQENPVYVPCEERGGTINVFDAGQWAVCDEYYSTGPRRKRRKMVMRTIISLSV